MAEARAFVTDSMRTLGQNPGGCIRVIAPHAFLENLMSFSCVMPASAAYDCSSQEIWYGQSVGELGSLRDYRVRVFRERHPVGFRPAITAIPFRLISGQRRQLHGHARFW